MSSRRSLILIVAVVVGAVAAFALFQYVGGIQDRAYHDAQRVRVYVVKKDVPKGTPGETAIGKDLVKASSIPQEFRPATALTDISQVKGKIALNNLSAGQVVVDGMFVDPRVAVVSTSQLIKSGRVAITVSVDSVHGVAGLLVPGDKVDMIVDDVTKASSDPNAKANTAPKRLLYQNVEVLAIGDQVAPQPGDTSASSGSNSSGSSADNATPKPGSNLITLSVPPVAAERIAYVGSDGIWLTLVPPDNAPAPVEPVDKGNLFTDQLTPYPDGQL